MPRNLIFKDAAKARDSITKEQLKEIKSLYENVANDLQKQMKSLERLDNTSSILQQQRLRDLQNSLNVSLNNVSKQIESNIKGGILDVSNAMCDAAKIFAKGYGLEIGMAYGRVPDDVVRKLVTGQVYDSGWSLSHRIWDIQNKTEKEIYNIVAVGLAENKGVYEIAKNLESYVNPNKRKQWNLKMADGKRIYKKQIDYNAQRLVRTMTQHAYQQSMIEVTKNNPWLKYYVWHANGSRVCPLCQARDGNKYKLEDLPLDHPNGMCVIEPDFESDSKITDDIANWINSDIGTYPEIDKYCTELTGFDVNSFKAPSKIKEAVVKQVVQKEYTRAQIERSSKFIKAYNWDDDKKERYLNIIEGETREFKNSFVNAMKKKVKVWEKGDGGYYSSAKNLICLDDGDLKAWEANGTAHGRQTLFHEIGHAIDDLAPGRTAKYSKSTKYNFKKAMLEDMKAMNEACKKGDKVFIINLKKMVQSDSSKGVQDAISAMHCKGIGLTDVKENVRVRWCHSQEYYERKDAKNEAASELFANICGAQVDEEAKKYMQKYFPNACKEFWRIINDIGK